MYLPPVAVDHHIQAEIGQVGDDTAVLGRDLGVLDQLVEVLLADAVLHQDVQQDDPDLVERGDVLVQQDRHDVAHVISDLLPLGVRAHRQVLLHLKGRAGTNRRVTSESLLEDIANIF